MAEHTKPIPVAWGCNICGKLIWNTENVEEIKCGARFTHYRNSPQGGLEPCYIELIALYSIQKPVETKLSGPAHFEDFSKDCPNKYEDVTKNIHLVTCEWCKAKLAGMTKQDLDADNLVRLKQAREHIKIYTGELIAVPDKLWKEYNTRCQCNY